MPFFLNSYTIYSQQFMNSYFDTNMYHFWIILCFKNEIFFLREVSPNLPAETASGGVGGGDKVTRRRFQGAASSPLLMPGWPDHWYQERRRRRLKGFWGKKIFGQFFSLWYLCCWNFSIHAEVSALMKNQHSCDEISAYRSVPKPHQPPRELSFDIFILEYQKEILKLILWCQIRQRLFLQLYNKMEIH